MAVIVPSVAPFNLLHRPRSASNSFCSRSFIPCAPVSWLDFLKSQHARRLRILDFQPDLARARSIRVLPVLRNDALKPELARVREDGRTVALEVLAEMDSG